MSDFTTDNLRVKATERYSFGFSDWRTIYGDGSITLIRMPVPRPTSEWMEMYKIEHVRTLAAHGRTP